MDWAGERDAGHVWNALSQLREEVGGLKASVQQGTITVGDVRTDIRDLARDINKLQTETSSQMGFVRGMVWAIGGALTLATIFLGVAWTSVIKPGLAHAIVEQIKPEIAKQVSDAMVKPNTSGTGQGTGARRQ